MVTFELTMLVKDDALKSDIVGGRRGAPAGPWIGRVTAGAGAGTLATGAMTLFMWAAQRAGALGTAPPRKITDRMLFGANRRWPMQPSSSRSRLAVSAGSHLAFGAASGALFSLVAPRVAAGVPRTLAGAVFGASIWATMYGYALPALGLMPRPALDRPGRPKSMAIAHLIYGVVLGALLSKRYPDRNFGPRY